MTRSEQKRMIQDLAYHTRAMSRDDAEKFRMMEKRDKDDEDLDSLSVKTLEALYERYMPKKSRRDADELWRKLTNRDS